MLQQVHTSASTLGAYEYNIKEYVTKLSQKKNRWISGPDPDYSMFYVWSHATDRNENRIYCMYSGNVAA